jgi:hypothetical protein
MFTTPTIALQKQNLWGRKKIKFFFLLYIAFYIIHGSEKKAIRKIFYTVPFTEYEEHGIAELERTLKEHPDIVLPEGYISTFCL